MNQDERKQTVASCPQLQAAQLVFQWVKSKVINFKEFQELYPLIDAKCECEDCGGSRGGMPGNENIVNGRVLCDYCCADRRFEPYLNSDEEMIVYEWPTHYLRDDLASGVRDPEAGQAYSLFCKEPYGREHVWAGSLQWAILESEAILYPLETE